MLEEMTELANGRGWWVLELRVTPQYDGPEPRMKYRYGFRQPAYPAHLFVMLMSYTPAGNTVQADLRGSRPDILKAISGLPVMV